jgi:hypothetical protein
MVDKYKLLFLMPRREPQGIEKELGFYTERYNTSENRTCWLYRTNQINFSHKKDWM